MDHDHQRERHTISDVKPVELLMEQLRQSTIQLAGVACDTRLELVACPIQGDRAFAVAGPRAWNGYRQLSA